MGQIVLSIQRIPVFWSTEAVPQGDPNDRDVLQVASIASELVLIEAPPTQTSFKQVPSFVNRSAGDPPSFRYPQ